MVPLAAECIVQGQVLQGFFLRLFGLKYRQLEIGKGADYSWLFVDPRALENNLAPGLTSRRG